MEYIANTLVIFISSIAFLLSLLVLISIFINKPKIIHFSHQKDQEVPEEEYRKIAARIAKGLKTFYNTTLYWIGGEFNYKILNLLRDEHHLRQIILDRKLRIVAVGGPKISVPSTYGSEDNAILEFADDNELPVDLYITESRILGHALVAENSNSFAYLEDPHMPFNERSIWFVFGIPQICTNIRERCRNAIAFGKHISEIRNRNSILMVENSREQSTPEEEELIKQFAFLPPTKWKLVELSKACCTTTGLMLQHS